MSSSDSASSVCAVSAHACAATLRTRRLTGRLEGMAAGGMAAGSTCATRESQPQWSRKARLLEVPSRIQLLYEFIVFGFAPGLLTTMMPIQFCAMWLQTRALVITPWVNDPRAGLWLKARVRYRCLPAWQYLKALPTTSFVSFV